MRRRGLTLMELMVALTMTVFVIAAAVSAYASAVGFENQARVSQESNESQARFEKRLQDLLRGAYVSTTTTDTSTYFFGDSTGESATATGADELTFTTISEGFNTSELSSDNDFETMNATFGPQGGVAEISLSVVPLGENGQSKQGLFIREQRPSDGDPTQGGLESVFDDDIKSIQFEFYNGSDWDAAWGTSGITTLSGPQSEVSGQDGRRIPAAIRVTYTRISDPNETQHVFIVKLPHSDVTAENPVQATGGTAAP